MNESLGERIRRLRVYHGMSQAELARRIHITSNAMNRIEMGDIPDPRASRIRDIARVLGVTTDCVLIGTDKESLTVTTPPRKQDGFVRNACVDNAYVTPNRLSPSPKIS